jgi:hypothetical protein
MVADSGLWPQLGVAAAPADRQRGAPPAPAVIVDNPWRIAAERYTIDDERRRGGGRAPRDRPRGEHSPFLRDIPFTDNKCETLRYFFDNPAYAWGDGSVLQAVFRYFRPKRLVEIGSGYLSACSPDTIDAHLNGSCEVTFIEPYPALL